MRPAGFKPLRARVCVCAVVVSYPANHIDCRLFFIFVVSPVAELLSFLLFVTVV